LRIAEKTEIVVAMMAKLARQIKKASAFKINKDGKFVRKTGN
jgi:hypothetical protein